MRGDLKHHHARGPEETVCDLPAVVPAGPASRNLPACLRESGMPGVAAAENPSRLAPPEPRLRYRLAHRPTRGADTIPARTVAHARPVEPTTLGCRERPVGPQGADFIGVMGALMVRSAKDQFRAYRIDPTRPPGTLPLPPRKTSPGLGHTESAGDQATGVSPARPAMGTSASPPTAPPAASDGLSG